MTMAPINEKALTKGELRKLTALRRSIGDELAEKVFAEWLRKKPAKILAATLRDRNADRIVETLLPMIERKQLTIRRGGYLIRRGRGRVIVEPNAAR